MPKVSKKELKQITEDRAYWHRVGKILGMDLMGWTHRDSAAFSRKIKGGFSKSYEIDWYMAEMVLRLGEKG